MKGSERIFKASAVQHIYQNTPFGGVIFYNIEDFLLFYTIFCTVAKKMKIKVVGLCLMINHIHILVRCSYKKELSMFVRAYTISFVKAYNRNKGRKGSLFRRNFGSASKVGTKKIMTSLSYLANNPVLKHLCRKPEKYQWGFWAYACNRNPFSKPLVISNATAVMRKSVTMVRSLAQRGIFLNYTLQKRLFENLSEDEKSQLIDLIITSYSAIDFREAVGYYGSYEKMIMAFNFNTGTEYEIKEDWDSDSDIVFAKMVSITSQMGYGGTSGFNFQHTSEEDLRRLAYVLSDKAHASTSHIAKFLHIDQKFAEALLRHM